MSSEFSLGRWRRLRPEAAYRVLEAIGGPRFAIRRFSPWALIRHLVVQRILRINAGPAWPVHWTSSVRHHGRMAVGMSAPGMSPGCYIQAINGIEIGDNVRIGPNVGIVSADHDLSDYDRHVPTRGIKIGDDCWIGMNSVITAGVTIGRHVVVAASSVVTEDVPDDSLVAGSPAVVIRSLPPYRGRSDVDPPTV